jgi:hypothetical protein
MKAMSMTSAELKSREYDDRLRDAHVDGGGF